MMTNKDAADLLIEAQSQATEQLEAAWEHIAEEVKLDEQKQYVQLVAAEALAAAINYNGLNIAQALERLIDAINQTKRD